jgi:hypothetical protein
MGRTSPGRTSAGRSSTERTSGGAHLAGADVSRAQLGLADLRGAHLAGADLRGLDLSCVDLSRANLFSANLTDVDLSRAKLLVADLFNANLSRATLAGADLSVASLGRADLSEANLSGARLPRADLSGADLRGAHLSGVNLTEAQLVGTNFKGADLTGCRVYGISAWNLKLEGAKQKDLVITQQGEPEITVDNLEVAQFIYLLLHNEKIRDVIDTITTKAVLILGRFTPKRKAVLDTLRDELRKRDRTPIVFDFDQPKSKNVTDTVKLLAQLARYIIVDLSDPNSAPYELGVISMLGLDSTPMVPLIASGQRPFPMLDDVLRKRWSTPRQVPGPRGHQGEPRRDAHQDR